MPDPLDLRALLSRLYPEPSELGREGFEDVLRYFKEPPHVRVTASQAARLRELGWVGFSSDQVAFFKGKHA